MKKLARALRKLGILTLVGILLLGPSLTHAFEITKQTVEDKNDFVLEPGKIELFLNPGQTATRSVFITSRISKPTKFKVEVEDFIGSHDEKNPVVLLGNDKSPYSIKDNIIPDVREFTLDFGQKISIPVTITVPANAQPGGFYASVLISNVPDDNDLSQAQGRARIVSRLGALVFVRVNGQANENGHLEDFRIAGSNKKLYNSGPFTFQILFNNDGNVHLVPYGTVTVKNILGKTVADLPVDAYFSLPNSTRYREVPWNSGFLFGRYKAEVSLNRGYGGIVDHQTIVFWVLPWKILLIIFGVLFVLAALIVFIGRNFELKKRK